MKRTRRSIVAEVEELERREAEAMLAGDADTLAQLWSEELIVNSTANLIAGKDVLLELIRSGRLRVTQYERRTQRLEIVGPIAVATGNEVSELAIEGSGLLHCSYMNIWRKRGGSWKLVARHVGLMARTNTQ